MKPLIQMQNVSHAFEDKKLFEAVSLSLGERQKIGVLGRNGAGKSTLLKILVGELEPDSGSVLRMPDLKLGYLRQADDHLKDESVQAYLERMGNAASWEAARMAARFELGPEILEQAFVDLPGGLQMRTRLTGLLLNNPNLLLLDEPTNYLDLRTLLMLEEFLQQSKQSFVLVSHDREFIRRTCEQTLEVENGQVVFFPGSLDAFLEFRQEDLDRKQRFNQNIEARRKTVQDFIDRFRAKASKASQARSRKKELDRLQTIEVPGAGALVKMRMPDLPTPRGVAFKAEGISIGYDDKEVASRIDLNIGRGSHVAVLGNNGEGKTTLLKSLAGQLPLCRGEIKRATGAKIAYYAQHVYHSMQTQGTVIDYLIGAAPPETPRQALLDMAGSFLFQGRDVERPLSVLSGGERARLCLAGLILSRADILLLDEPTNHLDFETAEALGMALRDYKGTVVLVSHDRTFVSLVATEILEVGGGRVRLYPGDYPSYVFSMKQALANSRSGAEASEKRGTNASENNQAARSVEKADETSSGGAQYKKRKHKQAELRSLKKQSIELEKQLEGLGTTRDELLSQLEAGENTPETGNKLATLMADLESVENEWLEAQEKISELESSLQN